MKSRDIKSSQGVNHETRSRFCHLIIDTRYKVLIAIDYESGNDHVHGLGIALSSAAESSEIMADLRVLTLDRIGVRFGLNMPIFWQDAVGAIMVGSVNFCPKIIHEQHLFQRFSTTRTDPEGKDFAGISVNCQPQPELAVFFPT